MKRSNFLSVFKLLNIVVSLLAKYLAVKKSILYLCLLLCLLNNSIAKAQTVECGTTAVNPLVFQPNSGAPLYAQQLQTPITVRLYFHVLRDVPHAVSRPLTDVYVALENLRSVYQPVGIQFELSCIEYVSNDDFIAYPCSSPSYVQQNWLQQVFQLNRHTDGIDIYAYTGAACSFGIAETIGGTALIVGGTNADGFDFFTSNIISHEMGHCLGLFHTHHGTCAEGGTDPNQCAELAIQPTNPADPNYNNGYNCGDYIDDTPASPSLQAHVNASCIWDGTGGCGGNVDVLGNPFDPPLTNVMSYSRINCRTDFTPHQGVKMRFNLLTFLSNVVVPQATAMANNWVTGTLPTGTIVWDQPKHVFGNLTVPQNSILQVQNTTLLMEGHEATITVTPQGKLIIDNTVLQNGSCHTDYWSGIRVLGNVGDLPTTFDPLTQTSIFQGIAIVKNNSIVKKARIGIANTNSINAWGNGIVIVQDSRFEDNDIGVFLARSGTGMPNNPLFTNKFCKIQNNSFALNVDYFENTLFDDDVPNLLDQPIGIVLGRAVYKNYFNSNTFTDNTTYGTADLNKKMIGMFINNARVEAAGNQFTNLHKGIDYYSTPSLQVRLYAHNNVFDRTHRCITLSGGLASNIYENHFHSIGNYNSNINPAYALFVDGAMATKISRNDFISSNNTPDGPIAFRSYGVIVRNTFNNYETLLTDNSFAGGFVAANEFEGNNRNISVDCNTYDNNILWDWNIALVSNATNGANILENQGECNDEYPFLARRNTFHNTTLTPVIQVPSYNIINNLDNVLDYKAQSPAFLPTQNLASAFGAVNVSVCVYDFPPISQCAADNADPDDPAALKTAIQNTTDERQKVIKYTQLIHARLKQDQIAEAKTDLTEENRDASNKVLTATYFDEGDSTKATNYLAQIPLTDADNTAFYNLFLSLIENNDAPTTGGRWNNTLLPQLQQAAQQNTPDATLAQVILANRYGQTFNKNISTTTPPNTTTLLATHQFSLTPNPASNTLHINLNQALPNAQISISNLMGNVIKTIPLTSPPSFGGINSSTPSFGGGKGEALSINTSTYPTGIYIVQLFSNGQLQSTQKLSIINR